jgi:hypothetical protein
MQKTQPECACLIVLQALLLTIMSESVFKYVLQLLTFMETLPITNALRHVHRLQTFMLTTQQGYAFQHVHFLNQLSQIDSQEDVF